MSVPTMWLDPQTGTSIQVKQTFETMLAPEVGANIKDIACSYNMMDDCIEFVVTRRDNRRARLSIGRHKLDNHEPRTLIQAFHDDPTQLAKLILFLA
jgi:hypothetical protein